MDDARKAGVRVIVCKACATNRHALTALEEQDVQVFYTGQFVADWLKSGEKLLTI
jgi:hypothetical protein